MYFKLTLQRMFKNRLNKQFLLLNRIYFLVEAILSIIQYILQEIRKVEQERETGHYSQEKRH